MSTDIESVIRLMASDIQAGARVRAVCPFCHAAHEKSFSVQRDIYKPYTLWFRCFRGNCGENGRVHDQDGVRMVLNQTRTSDDEYAVLPEYMKMPKELMDTVENTYHIRRDYLLSQGCRYNPDGNAIAMPWVNNSGAQVGWVQKSFAFITGVPKSRHQRLPQYKGRLAFPRINRSYSALPSRCTGIIVESVLDAYRINSTYQPTYYAVALNGSHISADDANTVGQVFDRVLVLLDPDMWPLGALKVMRSLRPWVKTVRATSLDTDPKDADVKTLCSFLSNIEDIF